MYNSGYNQNGEFSNYSRYNQEMTPTDNGGCTVTQHDELWDEHRPNATRDTITTHLYNPNGNDMHWSHSRTNNNIFDENPAKGEAFDVAQQMARGNSNYAKGKGYQ